MTRRRCCAPWRSNCPNCGWYNIRNPVAKVRAFIAVFWPPLHQSSGTLDGDGQNPPSELPKLFTPLLQDTTGHLGLVAGQRVDRQDTASKRWASKFANALRSRLLNDGTRDTGCGLKGFRRDAFLRLPYFDHMHRYLPALFKRDGWEIALVDVSHRERQGGQSNYNNFQRALVGVYDLIGVAWLIRRRKKAHPQGNEHG